ncbi:MAG: hypothetical protein ABJB11_05835 [Ferruginibacter sp.]
MITDLSIHTTSEKMGNSNSLFDSLFNATIGYDDKKSFLSQVVAEHPYFAPAQFYLLQQMNEGESGYRLQAAKTALLFNNLYWLQFQLEETLDNLANTTEVEFSQHYNQEAIFDNAIETNVIVSESFLDQTSTEYTSPVTHADSNISLEDNSIVNEEVFSGEPIISTEKEIAIEEVEIIEDVVPVKTQEEFIPEDIKESIIPVDEEPASANSISHFSNKGEERFPESPEENEDDEELLPEEGEPLNFKLILPEVNITEQTLSFEPLHTSDYFASLGIKLSGEIKPNDKLGKQLKSFTEWLKTMKKIHNDILPETAAQTEISIQKLAENSNKEGEVLTEAMAEVLIQQGKAKKAIDVYKKLSLLNPSKTVYFAAKIDQLKEA